MFVLSAWKAAAVVLYIQDKPMHYLDITDEVLKADNSGLEKRNGMTPSETLLREISQDKNSSGYFKRVGDGIYSLPDDSARVILEEADVALAISTKLDELLAEYQELNRSLFRILREDEVNPKKPEVLARLREILNILSKSVRVGHRS